MNQPKPEAAPSRRRRYHKFSVLGRFIKRRALFIRNRPFYLKYPKISGMKLSTIDSRGAIDFDLGIFYSRIPKAANSFIIRELFRLKAVESVHGKILKKRLLSPSDLDRSDVAALDELLKFTFVRNPYARTLSAFVTKVVRKNVVIPEVSKTRGPTFPEFCSYLEHSGLFANIHWAPQSSLILLPVERFDIVGKVENMDRDFRRVLDEIRRRSSNLSLPLADERREESLFRQPKSDEKVRTEYDARSIDIVNRLFADDFRQFHYEMM